jgi:hypothetical protein
MWIFIVERRSVAELSGAAGTSASAVLLRKSDQTNTVAIAQLAERLNRIVSQFKV